MKVLKETDNILLYKPNSGNVLIAIKLFDSNSVLTQGGVCDFCNKQTTHFYLCPELGHNAICEDCFKSRLSRAKWYEEDMHFAFNTLISFVCHYDLKFTEESLDIINEFFEEHSHRDKIDIRKFMEVFKNGQ